MFISLTLQEKKNILGHNFRTLITKLFMGWFFFRVNHHFSYLLHSRKVTTNIIGLTHILKFFSPSPVWHYSACLQAQHIVLTLYNSFLTYAQLKTLTFYQFKLIRNEMSHLHKSKFKAQPSNFVKTMIFLVL